MNRIVEQRTGQRAPRIEKIVRLLVLVFREHGVERALECSVAGRGLCDEGTARVTWEVERALQDGVGLRPLAQIGDGGFRHAISLRQVTRTSGSRAA